MKVTLNFERVWQHPWGRTDCVVFAVAACFFRYTEQVVWEQVWTKDGMREIGRRSKEGLRGRIVCEERLERVPGCHARTGTASTIVVGESYRFVIQAAKRTRWKGEKKVKRRGNKTGKQMNRETRNKRTRKHTYSHRKIQGRRTIERINSD